MRAVVINDFFGGLPVFPADGLQAVKSLQVLEVNVPGASAVKEPVLSMECERNQFITQLHRNGMPIESCFCCDR